MALWKRKALCGLWIGLHWGEVISAMFFQTPIPWEMLSFYLALSQASLDTTLLVCLLYAWGAQDPKRSRELSSLFAAAHPISGRCRCALDQGFSCHKVWVTRRHPEPLRCSYNRPCQTQTHILRLTTAQKRGSKYPGDGPCHAQWTPMSGSF